MMDPEDKTIVTARFCAAHIVEDLSGALWSKGSRPYLIEQAEFHLAALAKTLGFELKRATAVKVERTLEVEVRQ